MWSLFGGTENWTQFNNVARVLHWATHSVLKTQPVATTRKWACCRPHKQTCPDQIFKTASVAGNMFHQVSSLLAAKPGNLSLTHMVGEDRLSKLSWLPYMCTHMTNAMKKEYKRLFEIYGMALNHKQPSWFSTFLMLWRFNTVPHIVVTLTTKLFVATS